jgi:acyl-CoA synthetase (NDP forming)
MLNHLDAMKLFAGYGVSVEGAECTILSEAEEKVAGGGTFFLKLVSSSEEATHKTEYGYVRRVHNPEELRDAWTSMEAVAKSYDHRDIRFILQEGRDGHEVMIGAKRDPIFGFQIIFTPEGGKYAEIHAKVAPPSVRVGRLTLDDALEMITEHPLAAKITGARGEASDDIDSLARLLVSISTLMDANPDIWAVDLNPVFVRPDGINVVDARVETEPYVPVVQKFQTDRNLTVFKKPKRAFAVLASAKPSSVGYLLLSNLLKSVGNVCVMLPGGKGKENVEQMGVPIVEDVPDGCDLLVYAGLPGEAPNIVRKFREKGGEGAVIISSDFAETGNKELEDELYRSAGDMPYIGPNGIGVYSTSLNTFFFSEDCTAYPATGGGIALFSQSGGLCIESFNEYLSTHKVPINEIFSLGNGSGISFTELLNSVADNTTVNSAVIHLEGGLKEGEGPSFIKALKKATSKKPVIVLLAGFSAKGRACAASHTGRMTGGADALLAALKQGGAVIATSEEQLRLAIWMLHVLPRSTGQTVVFTTGGGKGVLATDAAERIGLELLDKLPTEFSDKVKPSMPSFADCTKNPFDFTGSVTLNGMLSILDHSKLLNSPGIFHVFYQVPGGTVRYIDGKPVKYSPEEAIELIAGTIRDKDLPFVLNICAQSPLALKLEKKAEQCGVVVTRTTSAELTLSALKLTTEVWKRYPQIDLRHVQETSDVNKDSKIAVSIR